jgi:hypothetical protein
MKTQLIKNVFKANNHLICNHMQSYALSCNYPITKYLNIVNTLSSVAPLSDFKYPTKKSKRTNWKVSKN